MRRYNNVSIQLPLRHHNIKKSINITSVLWTLDEEKNDKATLKISI